MHDMFSALIDPVWVAAFILAMTPVIILLYFMIAHLITQKRDAGRIESIFIKKLLSSSCLIFLIVTNVIVACLAPHSVFLASLCSIGLACVVLLSVLLKWFSTDKSPEP